MEKFNIDLSSTEEILDKFINKKFINVSDNQVKLNFLANSTRRQIINIIKLYPGIHISLMKRHLHLGSYQLFFHLSLLEEFHLINSHKIGNVKIFGLSSSPLPQMILGFLICKDTVRTLFKNLIQYSHGDTMKNICKFTQIPITTLIHWIKKLIKMNLILQNTTIPKKIMINQNNLSQIKKTLSLFSQIFI